MKNSDHHYDLLAQKFNTLWQFSPDYKTYVIDKIKSSLTLSIDDILVDIGGGTGTFTNRLLVDIPLCGAYCIEPSHEMSAQASLIEGLTAICTDANGFIDFELTYTKVLLKEVVHHINDRPHLWRNLYEQLPQNGKILIITRPQEIAFPFWSEAKAAFAQHQPSLQTLTDELQSSHFDVRVEYGLHTFHLSKEEWYTMLRHRFMSDLTHFTDEQIEQGISEIDRTFLDPLLEMNDHLIFITATKSYY